MLIPTIIITTLIIFINSKMCDPKLYNKRGNTKRITSSSKGQRPKNTSDAKQYQQHNTSSRTVQM